ncbi:MAG: Type I restriction-modification system methyltransferase subunit [Methanomicrobiales archaeon 53_19]|uniref:hypothetical protein n=1 Tax=Methanocalculus sp. TaxID=2004547 RepID=UPI000747608C|nr:hypothetical protein [Methanocalculus sp.]KUK70323.1 MAG: Type I restriction-modification system methyltransferase subunit [Methanocalculus sp. 52_23]KUL04414.1 MAG: Type I restriction-modification system methyltransferase subunit [Methanomicrobiales archaeon 53_19]HIJ07004.1 hypothetical protein [Methanocalculus sp.]
MDVPDWITTFITSYASGKNYQSILSPYGDDLELLHAIKEGTAAVEAVAITDTPAAGSPYGIQVIRGDPASILDGCTRLFDLILLFSPLDQRNRTPGPITEEETGNHPPHYDLLSASADLLSERGALIAIIHSGFFLNTIVGELSQSGLFCEAALTLRLEPSPQLQEEEQMLIIIRRGEREMIMAGELTPARERHEILIRNLTLQKNGKRPELGYFIRRSGYRSLHEILLEEQISRLAEEHGTPRVPFSGITRSITTGACGTLQDAGRRIYLPFSPAAPPVISHEDLSVPPSDAACILLRPGTVEPEYLIHFFQTALGRDIRELVMRRSRTMQHFASTLAETEIYLPPPQIQAEVIAINASIESARDRLRSIQRELWMRPKSTRSVLGKLERLREGEGITEWMETLPFPLASIIWIYYAERSPAKKVGHLLNFFEASAEFIAGMLLSALDPILRDEEIDLLDENPGFRDIYMNATFRSWIILCRRSGRQVRKKIAGDGGYEEMERLFGNADREFIDMVTSKRLFALLDEVADLRNDWKGHGGITGERDDEEQLATLERLLERFREGIRDHFNHIQVILPGAAEYREGIFTCQVQSVTGTRARFQGMTITSLIPLDAGSLYLYSGRGGEPMKLLPFFRLIVHPETGEPAWYFYNRIEGRRVRWISYHYEAESECEEEEEEVYEMLRDLGLITGE